MTASPEETEALAAGLAGRLRAGDVVAVSGELGAGKTTFVRGAARALGVTGPVLSPTFTIGHRYEAQVPVAHLDLYRIAGLDPRVFDVAIRASETIAAERVSILLAVPAMLNFMLQVPDLGKYDCSSLRWIMSGAAPVPVTPMAPMLSMCAWGRALLPAWVSATGMSWRSAKACSVAGMATRGARNSISAWRGIAAGEKPSTLNNPAQVFSNHASSSAATASSSYPQP